MDDIRSNQVELDDDTMAIVHRLAAERMTSATEVVAEAVSALLRRHGGGTPDAEVAGDGPAADLD